MPAIVRRFSFVEPKVARITLPKLDTRVTRQAAFTANSPIADKTHITTIVVPRSPLNHAGYIVRAVLPNGRIVGCGVVEPNRQNIFRDTSVREPLTTTIREDY